MKRSFLHSLFILSAALLVYPLLAGAQFANNAGENRPAAAANQWTAAGKNIFYKSGNVGIGTNAPASPLHVKGDIRIPSNKYGIVNEYGRRILETGTRSGLGEYTALNSGYDWNSSSEPMSVVATQNSVQVTKGNPSTRAPYASTLVKITDTGNMGIGAQNPAQKLEVAGSIKLSGNIVSDNTISISSGKDICLGNCR